MIPRQPNFCFNTVRIISNFEFSIYAQLRRQTFITRVLRICRHQILVSCVMCPIHLMHQKRLQFILIFSSISSSFSVSQSVTCLSVCQFVNLSFSLSVSHSISQSVCLCVYLLFYFKQRFVNFCGEYMMVCLFPL